MRNSIQAVPNVEVSVTELAIAFQVSRSRMRNVCPLLRLIQQDKA
ncbi:hypothetical protein [Brunnivagina elsteri]|nr:hypothetical protein [Calothrix elsteri]